MTNQEAIDLLDNLIGMIEDNHGSDYDSAIRMAIDALKNQPEVIRCKDCIHYIPLGSNGAWGKCHMDSLVENQGMCMAVDFCSWAELRGDSNEN